MFYACLSLLVLLGIMIFCVSIAIYDLERYNFGLYIVLLCIVGKNYFILNFKKLNIILGSMLACAFFIANPTACTNPVWYTNFCVMMQVSKIFIESIAFVKKYIINFAVFFLLPNYLLNCLIRQT